MTCAGSDFWHGLARRWLRRPMLLLRPVPVRFVIGSSVKVAMTHVVDGWLRGGGAAIAHVVDQVLAANV